MKNYRLIILIFFLVVASNLNAQSEVTTIVPRDGQILFQPKVVFNWNRSFLETQTSTYSLSLSQDSLFNTSVYTSINLSVNLDSFVVNSEGRYFWKVNLIDAGQIISSSKVFSFTYSNIYNTPGMVLFLRADTGLVLNSMNEVEKWYNLADTSKSATPVGANTKPLSISNPNFSGNSVVRLDGTDDLMEINTNLPLAELFCVANWGTGASNFPFYNGLISGKTSYYAIIANGAGAPASRTKLLGTSLFPNFQINRESTLDFTPLNEFKFINISRGSAFQAPDFQIGRDRTFTNRYWNGDLAEIIAFSNPLNDSLKKVVNTYLCKKYGKELSLGKDIIASQSFCDTLVSVDTNYISYRWSNGDTTSFSNLSPGVQYTLTVTNQFGCEYSDDISIVVPIVSPDNQFLCIGDTFTYDTKYSNSDFSFSWSDMSSDSLIKITRQGEYYVTIADTNGCFFDSDTFRVSYDSSLVDFTLGPDTSVCKGNELSLINGSSVITSYVWSTGNTAPTQLIDTGGIYTLKIGNGKCFDTDTIDVTVKGEAPLAKFNFTDLCLNDSVQFTDLSTPFNGDTITKWKWIFGDGDSSMSTNPVHQYSSVANYTILLNVETDKGCSDTVQRNIQIQPLPVSNFGFQSFTACSKNPISLFDSSTVSFGNINSYNWNFGDVGSSNNTSNLKNPLHQYDTLGNYIIRLIVETAEGCRDTISKVKYINPTPNIKFNVEGRCINDSITFVDQTILPAGSVSSYRWVINQLPQTSNLVNLDSTFKTKFSSPGLKTIAYRVQTAEGCQSIAYDTIQLFANPTAAFNIPPVCEGDSFRVSNTSSSVDSIANYRFIFNASDTSMLTNPTFFRSTINTYSTTLKITTINGCTDSTDNSTEVKPKPQVDFSILNNQTGVPFTVDLENNTSGAIDYFWDFGNGDTSQAFLPAYTYTDTGRFNITLKAISAFGCEDSLTKELTALPFFLDALLNRVFLQENQQGEISVTAQVFNAGFNTIQEVKLTADLNNKFRFSQEFTTEILKGNSEGLQFDALFSENQGRKVDFICVQIESVNGIGDSIQTNNEICQKTFNDDVALNVYPNPVQDFLTFEYVLPIEGRLNIQFFDRLGRKVLTEINTESEEGYYSNLVNVINLKPGIYQYRFIFNGVEKTGSFLKR